MSLYYMMSFRGRFIDAKLEYFEYLSSIDMSFCIKFHALLRHLIATQIYWFSYALVYIGCQLADLMATNPTFVALCFHPCGIPIAWLFVRHLTCSPRVSFGRLFPLYFSATAHSSYNILLWQSLCVKKHEKLIISSILGFVTMLSCNMVFLMNLF